MSLSMFEITVPGFFGSFQAMNTWFAKAQAHADDCKLDSINDLGLRLAPDMLPLTKQVQIATDMAKGCVARLAGHDVPKWDDRAATLDDLRAREAKLVGYVQLVPAELNNGSEAREIVVPMRSGEQRMSGQAQAQAQAHVLGFVLPKVYFHATTTDALLRHAGIEVGKLDFFGLRG